MLCEKVFQVLLNLPFIFLVFPQEAKGLDLDYQLTLQGDGSGRPHITLQVNNLSSESLKLAVNTPLVDDSGNYLITMIHNFSVKGENGDTLGYSFTQETIINPVWYWFNLPIYYDVYTINTDRNRQITVEYDAASNTEIYRGLGATNDDVFWGKELMVDFWHGYLELILFRPENQSDVSAANICFSLPPNWDYEIGTLGTRLNNEVDLGTLDGMYGDNIIRWKNYQRSLLVIYDKSKFNVKAKDVRGIRVADVYSADVEGYRNQEAFFQYFEYLCDRMGTLPITNYLTFYTCINGNQIPYLRAYIDAPYSAGYGVSGRFYGDGGDIGIGCGQSLDHVQLWEFDSFDNEKTYSTPMHATVRPWICFFIQFDPFTSWFKGGFSIYYENMCIAQRYGLDNIIERRLRPMYKYYIDNIAGPPEVDKKNFSNHSFVEYFKSCLTAYYIDQLLKENSGGTKTIDDLMKLLFQKAEQGVAIDREIFTEALNSLTGYDFTSVIEKYLYGTEKLPLDGYLTNAPRVITGSATSVTSTSATLNGTVNPKGEAATYYFEYGTDTNYGSTTSSASAGSGSSAVSVSAAVLELALDTTYHYRLVATNSEGTSYGEDKTFRIVILYVEPSGSCGGNTPCYSTIQAAINAAETEGVIRILQGTYDEEVIMAQAYVLTLSGGWDFTFATQSATSTVKSMTINDGCFTIDSMVIQ